MEGKTTAVSFARDDAESFKEIVEKYGACAMALALNILRNQEDAEDACQEAFIQAFCNLDKFDMRKNFKNWFYAIVYRRSLDMIRKRHRRGKLIQAAITWGPSFSNPRSGDQEKNRMVPERLLEELSFKERTALTLWANEGYTSVEISQVLRCSSSTARVYLFNARRKIKVLLEKKNVSLQSC